MRQLNIEETTELTTIKQMQLSNVAQQWPWKQV